MFNKDSTIGTISVAFVLCVVCSVLVSMSAVLLKPAQVANKALDFKRNILTAAGMLEEGKSVEELFSNITIKLVDLETGKYYEGTDLTPETYDQRSASKDLSQSEPLAAADDVAKLSRLEKVAAVYVVENGNQVEKIILPVRGYGLWGTLYGFVGLESDLNTVLGLGFYEHSETPGLGGEVNNPAWMAKWPEKQIFDANGALAIEVLKGTAPSGSKHQVDGLSGATLTTRGVNNLVRFWLGEGGFGPFLDNLKNGKA